MIKKKISLATYQVKGKGISLSVIAPRMGEGQAKFEHHWVVHFTQSLLRNGGFFLNVMSYFKGY